MYSSYRHKLLKITPETPEHLEWLQLLGDGRYGLEVRTGDDRYGLEVRTWDWYR